jgi:hypothetical protein
MSNTRYAPVGAPISYERYMSSPEFTDLRAIPGTAVAAKADLYDDVRKRSLLFFLHSLSLERGGLRQVARDLAKTLPLYGEEQLTRQLIELCINPKVILGSPAEARLCDVLWHFQDQYEAKAKEDFIMTSIGQEVFDSLDHALAIRKMVVIEGNSGIGKRQPLRPGALPIKGKCAWSA